MSIARGLLDISRAPLRVGRHPMSVTRGLLDISRASLTIARGPLATPRAPLAFIDCALRQKLS
jgi:hypothetical protein